VLGDADAVLSGYQGAADMGEVILQAVRRVKELNPRAVYCCDPVMGDVGRGMFVLPGIPELIRERVVCEADILTPNHFELDFLAGRETRTLADVLDAVDTVRERGPRTVLVTSVLTDETAPETLTMVAVDDAGAWLVTTPLLPITPNGCGDLTSALFLAHLLLGRATATALGNVAGTVFGILELTLAAGTREIQLVAGQDLIAVPPVVQVTQLS
ncbi:MAG: pyridoxal kinase, partial [Actinomycetota bacterium]|nr:pyridoxal kinase [Actinomycetota bacterium]